MDWTAEPAQPAPGYRNSELYPEMDSQTIPPDMREKMAAVKKTTVKKATVKKARRREKVRFQRRHTRQDERQDTTKDKTQPDKTKDMLGTGYRARPWTGFGQAKDRPWTSEGQARDTLGTGCGQARERVVTARGGRGTGHGQASRLKRSASPALTRI